MPKIRYYLIIILLTISFSAFINSGCSEEKELFDTVPTNRITLIKNDTLIQFYTKPVDDELPSKFPENRYYTWYRADMILVTKGAYAGKLLHGDYMELYPNRALKQKGKYQDGVKDGKWQSWFQNGEREAIITWKNGQKDGKFEFYSLDGKLQKEGSYSSDKENGDFSDFLPDGKIHKTTYKGGKIIADTIINKML